MVLIFFIYGLFIGSFLNVCIIRIPAGISIVTPCSFCGSCGHKLNYIDMLPVINYMVYKGRCRYCGEHYSLQYPIVELTNGVFYALVYLKYSLSAEAAAYCVIISILIAISIIDIKHMIIPDGLNIAGAITGFIYIAITKSSPVDKITGALIGLGSFLAIALLTHAMGGGDIKLMIVVGLMFGTKGVLFIIFCSFAFGAVVSLILLIIKIKDRKDRISFSPFISLSAVIYIFFGLEIVNQYILLF
jgi:leader peptidase (prepilin peptidase)/N-methyltransferase